MDQIEAKKVPGYLRSYLNQRTLLFEGYSRGLSSSVSQRSIRGPLLWNIAFDGVLNLRYYEM